MTRADIANKVYQIFLRDGKALDENDAEVWRQIALADDITLQEFIELRKGAVDAIPRDRIEQMIMEIKEIKKDYEVSMDYCDAAKEEAYSEVLGIIDKYTKEQKDDKRKSIDAGIKNR